MRDHRFQREKRLIVQVGPEESESDPAVEAPLNEDWYANRYHDVPCSGLSVQEHYRRLGRFLGRRASPVTDAVVENGCALPSLPEPARQNHRCSYVDLGGQRIQLTPQPSFGSSDYEISPSVSGPVVVLPMRTVLQSATMENVRVAVHLHLHYTDLAGEIAQFLSSIPFPFALLISVTDGKCADHIAHLFESELDQAEITVAIVANRGRDIAAMVTQFAKELSKTQFFAHIHTKRSPHNRAKADWRDQLLHGLMASSRYVENIFAMFEANPHIGLVFPEYHWALEKQISWGTNFSVCQDLADRLHIHITEDSMRLFPAGSMFWARTAALKPLLEADFGLDEFPVEAGQVDGTAAHGIERLLGEIAWQSGYGLQQIKPDRQHSLTTYYSTGWPCRLSEKSVYEATVLEYRSRNRGRKNRVAVFTAITGGYDDALVHECLDERVDYYLFTDGPAHDRGFWRVRSIDYYHPDPVRRARYVKTHPHKLLPGYETAVWIDASVMIRGEIMRYVSAFEADQQHALHGVDHPQRDCTFEEANALTRLGKDAASRIRSQMDSYRAEGLDRHSGLVETNFLIADLRCSEVREFYRSWWGEIVRFSHRDQLGIMIALRRSGARWAPVFNEKKSLRNHPDFAYFGHGSNSGLEEDTFPEGKLVTPALVCTTGEIGPARPAVDIVVCVHNALEESRQCLTALEKAMTKADRLFIVDDASGYETRDYLQYFSAQMDAATLIRHEGPARGYCRSANEGMKQGQAEFVLLLNSDAIVLDNTIDKLLGAAKDAAIVGPMSNAASFQSLPDIKANPEQTAVNALPEGVSASELDLWCESSSARVGLASVPLVHGFCQLIRRTVLNEVGGFDEDHFPFGYGEENDFCFRVANRGYDLRVATNTFVYHVKSASYRDADKRRELMRAGAQSLRDLHGHARLENAVRAMHDHPVLVEMRALARADFFKEYRDSG